MLRSRERSPVEGGAVNFWAWHSGVAAAAGWLDRARLSAVAGRHGRDGRIVTRYRELLQLLYSNIDSSERSDIDGDTGIAVADLRCL